jgi:hypothetical protein
MQIFGGNYFVVILVDKITKAGKVFPLKEITSRPSGKNFILNIEI